MAVLPAVSYKEKKLSSSWKTGRAENATATPISSGFNKLLKRETRCS
jgi:hypothetical protein